MSAESKLPSLHRMVQCQNGLYLTASSVQSLDLLPEMQVLLAMNNSLTSASTYITAAKARELGKALIEVADFYDAAAADMQAKAA